VDQHQPEAAQHQNQQRGGQHQVGDALAGIEVAAVVREAAGEGRARPAGQPGAVAAVEAERRRDEAADRPGAGQQQRRAKARKAPAAVLVGDHVRDAQQPCQHARLPLAAEQQPPAGGEQRQRRQVDDRVEPAGRARVALDPAPRPGRGAAHG
jgi:hypothetical protein